MKIFNSNNKLRNYFLLLIVFLVFIFTFVSKRFSNTTHHIDYHYKSDLKSKEECILTQQKKLLKSNNKRKYKYLDLNKEQQNQHILLLTTIFPQHQKLDFIKQYIDNYFDLIDSAEYPNKYITLGFLIANTVTKNKNKKLLLQEEKNREQQQKYVLELLEDKVEYYKHKSRDQFFQINIYQKDLNLSKNQQRLESTKAKAKNILLASTLKEYHEWIFWIDIELYSFPTTIFKDFISLNEDVVVPNCLMKRDNPAEFWGYDNSNWQETDYSLQRQQDIDQNQIIANGYYEYSIGRSLLLDMPTEGGLDHKVTLDGLGESFIMVRSTVHRQGAIFPPFVYQHQINTEGFAKMSKSMGFDVYGLPGYVVYHY